MEKEPRFGWGCTSLVPLVVPGGGRAHVHSAGWGSGMETSGRSQTLEDKDKKRALYRTVPSGWAQIGWVPGFLEGLGIRATDNRLIDFS